MRKRKQSASRATPLKRSFKRDNLPGRTRGGRHAERVDASFAGFLRRLRRLEFGVLALMGHGPKDFDLDRFVESVLSLEADAKIESRGRNVRGGEVQVPHEGRAQRKTARKAKNLRRPESGNEDGESSPFPPGDPDEDPS